MPQMVSVIVHIFKLNQGQSKFRHAVSAVIQSVLFILIFVFLI